MKLDTVIKLGSLAFGVARDDRIRELLKIAHNGAKRRGFYDAGPIIPPPGPSVPHPPIRSTGPRNRFPR